VSSCRTPNRVGFHSFTEKRDWVGYSEIARQKIKIFKPDEHGRPSEFVALADRIDYCEAYGASVNAAIKASGDSAD
jgi:hypothetical protein